MKQYHNLIKHVLENGTRKLNRTGVDTISVFNYNYEINLNNGFPLLTTKKINWKNIVIELLWFLSGKKNIDFLKLHGCKFWDTWAGKDNIVPSAYGSYWRKFPYTDRGLKFGDTDQISWVLNEMRNNPESRRMVVSAWYPQNAEYSKLPPCHYSFVFNVQNINNEQRLCLHLTQRSADLALGVPYNIASYSLLLYLMAQMSGLKVGIFAHSLVDAHIYTAKENGDMAEYNHIIGLIEQLKREPKPLPKLTIDSSIRELKDIDGLMVLSTEDIMKYFVLENYDPFPAINFKVAV